MEWSRKSELKLEMISVLFLLGSARDVAAHPTAIPSNIEAHPNRNKRAFAKVGVDWAQTDSDGIFVIPYGYGPNTADWKDAIEEHMTSLSADIGCFRTVRVDDMATTTWDYGIVFGNGDEYGDGQCWSALGMTPGFQGSLTKTVTQLGAPAGWQAISLSKTCQPITVGIIHHEVGHVLGKIHEFTRPDRDDYITLTLTASGHSLGLVSPKNRISSSRYPMEIGSTMNYCSSCITRTQFDMVSKNGDTWGDGGRQTTLDVLKIEEHYCLYPKYKNIVTCPKPDLGGVYLPVFADRLCDNFPDCPEGTDEDGSMFECGHGDKTPGQCCNHIVISYQGLQLGQRVGKISKIPFVRTLIGLVYFLDSIISRVLQAKT